MTTPPTDFDSLLPRLQRLGLHGLIAQYRELGAPPWVTTLVDIEEAERTRRGLQRRVHHARLGAFKPIDLFDWTWPNVIDRQAVEDAFALGFIAEKLNLIFLGPNGVGKTMIIKNIAHHALVAGHTVVFTTASDMLADLAAQESSTALARRLRRWTAPRLLCIDEVGYLSYNARYADLLFEVVTRRYESERPILLSTNKAFAQWPEVFPNATCTVTLVDRLLHRSDVIEIQGESYRLKEAQERAAAKVVSRKAKRTKR